MSLLDLLAQVAGNANGPSDHHFDQIAQQASRLSPQQVQEIASHAEQHSPGIVDQVGQFYAQHPTLVKTVGGAALAIALSKMKDRMTS